MINIILKSWFLINNFEYFNTNWNIVWPCLKKDAYWLWINNIINILSSKNLNSICTDSIIDILKIRKTFSWDILYFWNISHDIIEKSKLLNFIPTIYSLEQIEYLDKNIKKVFIELNSWLNRYWCNKSEIEILIKHIIKKWIEINWVGRRW